MKIEYYLLLVLVLLTMTNCSQKGLHGNFIERGRIVDVGSYSSKGIKLLRNGRFITYPGSYGNMSGLGFIGCHGKGKYKIRDGYLYFSFKDLSQEKSITLIEKTPVDTFDQEYNFIHLTKNKGMSSITIYDDFRFTKYSEFNPLSINNPIAKIPKSVKVVYLKLELFKEEKFVLTNDTSMTLEVISPFKPPVCDGKTCSKVQLENISKDGLYLDGVWYNRISRKRFRKFKKGYDNYGKEYRPTFWDRIRYWQWRGLFFKKKHKPKPNAQFIYPLHP